MDCPGLREWCKRHRFQCIQDISIVEELTITTTTEITNFYGVDNLSSLKRLCLNGFLEPYLSSDEWLPPTVQTLELRSSENLKSLSLHQNVSSLRQLFIEYCKDLTSVVGIQNTSLKELVITCCPKLQLTPDEYLPSSLQSLEVNGCMSLRSLPLHLNLSSLEKLKINDCLNLMSVVGIQDLTSLKELVIKECPKLQLSPDEYLPSSLQSMEVNGCESLRSLPLHLKLEKLTINDCLNLMSVVGIQNLDFLKELVIKDCPKFQLSPYDCYLPSSLHSLEVNGCESLRSLPVHLKLSSLEKLKINDCLNLMSVVGIQYLNSLKELVIKDCPTLQLSPNEYLPWSLHSLNVSDCKSLRSLPLLHHKMSPFEFLKLSNCSSLTDVCGISDLPSLRFGIIWDCPEVLLSSEERLHISCPLQLELATSGPRPQQSET